jgi:hypothetical protein
MNAREPAAPRERLRGTPRALCVALVLVIVVILAGVVCGCAAGGRRECAVSKPWRHSSSRRRGLPYFRPPGHYLASQIARPLRRAAEVVQEAPTSHVVPLYGSPWWPGVAWRRDELYDVLFPGNPS